MSGRTWVLWCLPDETDAEVAAALREREGAGDTVRHRTYAGTPAPRPWPRGQMARVVGGLLRRGGEPGITVHLTTRHVAQHADRIAARVGQEVLGRDAGLDLLAQARRWDAVDRTLRMVAAKGEREPLRPTELVESVRALLAPGGRPPGAGPRGVADVRLGADPMPLRLGRLRTVARRLVRQNRHAQVLDLLDPVLTAWDPEPTLGLHALAAHARTSLTGTAPPDLAAAAAAALEGADAALPGGDLDLVAELVTIGAGLLLHRDLHADAAQSPLVEDTEAFLAPLRRSRAMRALASPRTRPQTEEVAGPAGPGRTEPRAAETVGPAGPGRNRPTRVVVLPGAYQRFAGSLVAELARRPGVRVEVVDLAADHPPFRWLGTDPALVRLRLSRPDEPPATDSVWGFGVTPAHLAAVRDADVVLADWADKGAVWASLVVRPATRLVVRAHGMDTFSIWPHLIDWSQVDALVSVSPHQAEVLGDVLRHGAVGALGAFPEPVVVPNIVTLPPVPDPPVRNPHALVLVGWAHRVKDPLWAVEVLAGLLAKEAAVEAPRESAAPGDAAVPGPAGHPFPRPGGWRLVLVGDGFARGGVATSRHYADSFAERIAAPDVAPHIEHVPQTDDVAREVARVGFVLSSSIRESFHQGLVEGVLGGAVPVVRDWPYFARRDGARRLYPADWVAGDVPAAVERIWALRAEADRARAAEHAEAEVAQRFDPERVGADLVRVLLGGSWAP